MSQKFGLHLYGFQAPCDVYGCNRRATHYIGLENFPYDQFHLCEDHRQQLLADMVAKETPAKTEPTAPEVVSEAAAPVVPKHEILKDLPPIRVNDKVVILDREWMKENLDRFEIRKVCDQLGAKATANTRVDEMITAALEKAGVETV